MIWIVLLGFLAVATVIGAVTGRLKEERVAGNLLKIFAMYAAGLVSSIIAGPLLSFEWEEKEEVALAELATGPPRKFLGVGDDADGKPFYRFLRKGELGYYPEKLGWREQVAIREEEKREGGTMKVYRSRFTRSFYGWFALEPGRTRYEFHVPERGVMKEWLIEPPPPKKARS